MPRALFAASALVGFLALSCSGSSQDGITVAAAANVRFAFQEIVERFEEETGVAVTLVIGSSGQLQQQVAAGAPYDVFVAADTASIEALAADGLTLLEAPTVYAVGRLALVARAGLGPKLGELPDLARPEIERVAIANPQHAPYGRAAVQALQAAGVWAAVQPKLVYGENVSQALTFVQTSDVDAAIVALSLVVEPRGAEGLAWLPIDPTLHDPLVQAMAVVARSPRRQAAERFLSFVTGPEGQAILSRYGYLPPEERP